MKHIPVTLLTGFLGSGKTTLLARALARPEFADSLVIVNEFGEVSIDHLIVADLAENIIELRDGCLCCTIRGDLVMTLRDLYRKRCLDEIPKFARVIVETTGLADPIPLIHTLMANPPLMKVFALDAVIAMVDSVHGSATLKAHDTASKQIAVADILVMSKVDCASPAAIAALRAQVSVINPTAELVLSAHGDIEATCVLERGLFQPALGADDLRRWLHTSPTSEDHHGHDHGAEYGAHVIEHEGPLSLAGTSVFLNRIVNEFSDEIVRIKGLAGFREKGGKPALLHAVQNKFYPVQWLESWPDSNTDSRLVFIGRGLDIARIDELFSALCV
jgi:G3E family GTPase